MVFPKKNFIFVDINHFPGQSVLLKIKENGPVNCFSQDLGSCFLGPPKRDYFFAVPWRGSFGHILTMQLEPPKSVVAASTTRTSAITSSALCQAAEPQGQQ